MLGSTTAARSTRTVRHTQGRPQLRWRFGGPERELCT
jgi:hypothetical protein